MYMGPNRNQIDWTEEDPNEPLILQEDLENSVIERIIRNEFYRSPVKYKPARINWNEWLAGANAGREIAHENGTDNDIVQDRRQSKPYVPGLHYIQYPQLSALTIAQHHQGLRVLNARAAQPRGFPTPSRADHTAFEAMKEAYEKEQKEYIKWAKQAWVHGDCIRALRPKPLLEATYDAEITMRNNVVQSLPQNYYLAAQIPLETNHRVQMKHKTDLITVDVVELPRVQYPHVIESSLSVLQPCPLPQPCMEHPCKFVLPNEDSVSSLPLTEIHRKLAEYAICNDTQFIASENSLHCLIGTQRSWNIPVSVIELSSPDGDVKNVIVLGSEFAMQKDYAMRRTYRAYRHLLQHAFTPSIGQYKIKKRNAYSKPKVSKTQRQSLKEHSFSKELTTEDTISQEPIAKQAVVPTSNISNETVTSKEKVGEKETIASEVTVTSKEPVIPDETIPSFSSFLALDDDLAVSSDDDDDRLLIDDISAGESDNRSTDNVSKKLSFSDTVNKTLSFSDTVKRKLSFCDTNETNNRKCDTTSANDCTRETNISVNDVDNNPSTSKVSDNLSQNIEASPNTDHRVFSELVPSDSTRTNISETDSNEPKLTICEAMSTKTSTAKTSPSETYTSESSCGTLKHSTPITTSGYMSSASDPTNPTITTDKPSFSNTSDASKNNFSEPGISNTRKQDKRCLTDITVQMNDTQLNYPKLNITNPDKSGLGDLSSISTKSSPEVPFSGFSNERLMNSLLKPGVRKVSFDGTEIEIASNFSEIDIKSENITYSESESGDVAKLSDNLVSPVVAKNSDVSNSKKGVKNDFVESKQPNTGNLSFSDTDNDRLLTNEANPSKAVTRKTYVLLSKLNISDHLTSDHSVTYDTSTEPPKKKQKTTLATRSYSLRSKPDPNELFTSSKPEKKTEVVRVRKTSNIETTDCDRVSESSTIEGLRRSSRFISPCNKDNDSRSPDQVGCKLNGMKRCLRSLRSNTDNQSNAQLINISVAIDKTDQSKANLCSNSTNVGPKTRKSLPENLIAKTEEKDKKESKTRNKLKSSNTEWKSEQSDRTKRYLSRRSTTFSNSESDLSETDDTKYTKKYNLRSHHTSTSDADHSESKSPQHKQHSSSINKTTQPRIRRSNNNALNTSQSNTDLTDMDISENYLEVLAQGLRTIKNETDVPQVAPSPIEINISDIKGPEEEDHIDFIIQIKLKTENNHTTNVNSSKTNEKNKTRNEVNSERNEIDTTIGKETDKSIMNVNEAINTVAETNTAVISNLTGKTEITCTKASDKTCDRTKTNEKNGSNTNKTLQTKLHTLFSDTDCSDDDALIKTQDSCSKSKETRPEKDTTDRLRLTLTNEINVSSKEIEKLDNTKNYRIKTNITHTTNSNQSAAKQTEQIDQSKSLSQTKLSKTSETDPSQDLLVTKNLNERRISKETNMPETNTSKSKETSISGAKETSTPEAKETNQIRSRSDSVVSNSSYNTEDSSNLEQETLNVSTLSKQDIDDIIGVSNCTCHGTIFEVPPPRSFKKWQLSNETSYETFDVIVHTSHKAREGDEEVLLEPIVEYQPEKGGTSLSAERVRALALSLMLRGSAALLNVHIDHEKGDVIVVERTSGDEFVRTHGDKSRDVAASLHCTLAQLRHLLPGQYVLHHDSCHGPNAMIYTTKPVSNGGVTLSLHQHISPTHDAHESIHVKTAPEIVPVLLPCHKYRRTLPCAFTPYKNQVREDKKKLLAQKPKHPPQAIQWPKKKKKKIRQLPRTTSYE